MTGEPAAPAERWRAAQSATQALATVPYGFTLSFGTSLALAVGRRDAPGLLDALMLVLGAIAGFTVLAGVAAHAELGRAPSPRRPSGAPWRAGAATAIAVSGTVCASWLAGGAFDGHVSWAAVGLVATLAYFGLTGLAAAVA